jgi:hypothetical protein
MTIKTKTPAQQIKLLLRALDGLLRDPVEPTRRQADAITFAQRAFYEVHGPHKPKRVRKKKPSKKY